MAEGREFVHVSTESAMGRAFSAIHTAFSILLLLQLSHGSGAAGRRRMGMNYGRLGDDLPAPAEAVALMRSLGVGEVKMFDSDPEVLAALAGSRLRVVVAATNEELQGLASSASAAEDWVRRRVRPFFPSARIRAITVGNEVLSHPENREAWGAVVPAMQNVQRALERAGLERYVKVSTCVAMDALGVSYPPSAGSFRADIAEPILKPMLRFLSSTDSYLFVNAYPYFAWSANSDEIPLDYALFGAGGPGVADGGLRYGDLLEAQLDSFVFAMEKLGFPDVRIAVSETGWPTLGGPGASADNAALYNGRLVQKMVGTAPPKGTPRRPGVYVPTFIFSLFNENLKPGPETERHWGVLYPNSSRVYSLDLVARA